MTHRVQGKRVTGTRTQRWLVARLGPGKLDLLTPSRGVASHPHRHAAEWPGWLTPITHTDSIVGKGRSLLAEPTCSPAENPVQVGWAWDRWTLKGGVSLSGCGQPCPSTSELLALYP